MKVGPKKIAVLAAIVLLIVSWFTVSKMRAARENQPEIRTAKVEIGTVASTVSASGVLEPLTTVDVKSNAGGRVDLLAVDVGSVVDAGQLLAKIDPSDSRTALNQASADLSAANARLFQSRENLILQASQSKAEIRQAEEAYRSAKARLEQAEAQAQAQPAITRSGIRQAEASYASAQETLRQLKVAGVPQGIAQAKASYDQAKASLEKARRNYERQQGLHKQGFIAASVLDAAQADYETARAQFESAQQKMNTSDQDYDAQLKAAQARVDQAKASLENAKANAVQDKVRRNDVVTARAALSQAQASLTAAKANARQIAVRGADIRSSEATVVRNQAQVDNARTQLDYTIIKAPRAGVILRKYVEAGTIITSGRSSFSGTGEGTSIVQLGDVSRMFVLASVDETDIAQVEMGQQVDITLDAYPDEIFEGTVVKVDPQTVTEQNVTTIPVKVEIVDPDARLKPGMNATCNFVVERKEDVLTVPTEAVKDLDGRYTVTVIKDGKQIDREVEVGIAGDDSTEIVSGLKEGDEVVTAVIEPQTEQNGASGGQRPGGGGSPMGGMGGRGRFH